MKDEMSSVDLHFLIRELQSLLNAKVEKVYESDHLLLHFHVPGKGNAFLRITDKLMHLIPEKEEMPEKPTQFAMILRKKIGGARLRSISQLQLERIALLEFTTKEKTHKIYIELFGGGNIIVCDDADIIQIAKKYVVFKDREIKRSAKYEFPLKNVFAEKEFIALLTKHERENISKALAMDIGLGGVYAAELCKRAGISATEKQSEKTARTLFLEFNNFLKEGLAPVVIGNESFPIPPKSLGKPSAQFQTFSEAISSLIKVKKQEVKNVELGKTERIALMQEEKVQELIKEAESEKRKGELIYEHYAVVEEIVRELKKAKEKYSWAQIKEKLKGHKVIKEINEKEGKVKIEL